ncbi:uncharacterized protein LOC123560639 [Mercenaria mercenaria]|uniref:uncharacterized protein LOC123560639 n=1 Tax=Mercenaria mercenaria TaxID=6596 RepID=UPI00234E9290|nr:uncharacterized protein LOC123560639 [Mercenaria mercenaria]
MSSADYNLRSWNSNSSRLRELATTQKVLDTDRPTKILGLRWDADADELFLQRTIFPKSDFITKREILQRTAEVYDPLGVLSPVTIRAKILLQDIWQQKYDWYVPLPEALQQRWNELSNDFNTVSSYKFQRYYFSPNDISDTADDIHNVDVHTTLHVFADASLRAYGAVAYLCRGNQSAFVMSKTRVAPLKELTLPKLELMAAVIAARLANHILQSITTESVHLWSDSQIVLHWLDTSKQLKRFVQNRVCEIHELTDNRKWKYCPTNDNPADLLTRGVTSLEYLKSILWMKGPSWLHDHYRWPKWEKTDNTVLTTTAKLQYNNNSCNIQTCSSSENTIVGINGIHNIMDVNRFSNYRKLLRVTAYVMRFIDKCRSPRCSANLELLTVHELQHAEIMWIRSCQSVTFHNEIDNMDSKGTRLPLVRQLRLFKDDTGIIRSGGDPNAPLDMLTKFPYLLPAKHPFTRLLIQDAHESQLHAGISTTITHLRQKFWIPAIRQAVHCVIRKCVTCRKVTGKQYTAPDPPPLPKNRVEDTPPFTVTGVDFTGALYVRKYDGKTETIMNDRPFTYVSSDCTDLQPLTPAHLLYGRRVSSLPYHEIAENVETDINLGNYTGITKRAKVQANLIRHFRDRLGHEYLTSLREHHQKTGNNKQTIKVGDVVQIQDDAPRNQWKLKIITDLITGNDGLTRAVMLPTKNGHVTSRPIVKLYPLELISHDEP